MSPWVPLSKLWAARRFQHFINVDSTYSNNAKDWYVMHNTVLTWSFCTVMKHGLVLEENRHALLVGLFGNT